MKKPIVTLKKIKTFQGMEMVGFNAEVYVNGVFCYTAINSGDGGQTDFRPNIFGKDIEKVKQQIKLLDEYIDTLPKKVLNIGDGKTFEHKVDLEMFVDDLLEEIEIQKAEKQMKKLMETSILFGVPNGRRYSYYNYKKPLFTFPKNILQMLVNQIKTKHCTDGVVILNTNLEKYDVVI